MTLKEKLETNTRLTLEDGVALYDMDLLELGISDFTLVLFL